MKARWWLLLLVSMPLMAEDNDLRQADFAYGMTLQGEAGSPFYTLELPEELYRHVTRGDLGDVRIFNGEGEVVPHLVEAAVAPAQQRTMTALPLFPLFAATGGGGGETTLRIVPDEKGTLIDLRSRSGDTREKQISHYLLDASAVAEPLQLLRLEWLGNDTFMSQVSVEGSDDLSHWHQVASATLAELVYGGERLRRNEIPLPAVKVRYLRLGWPLGTKQMALSGAFVEGVLPGAETPLHWSRAEPLPGHDSEGRYRFAMQGYYPVERVAVVLPQQNSVVRARLSSADSDDAKQWRQHFHGTIYSLQQDGERLDSAPLTVSPTTQRYWRLEVERNNGGAGSGQPQLKLGWRAQHLIFVARGRGPFTLAFGSTQVKAALPDSSLQGVLDALRKGREERSLIKPVMAQPLHILGGEERLRPTPPPLPWRRWLLWGILVLGVIMMVLMARNLYRQMNRT